jgi:hypothetical protein
MKFRISYLCPIVLDHCRNLWINNRSRRSGPRRSRPQASFLAGRRGVDPSNAPSPRRTTKYQMRNWINLLIEAMALGHDEEELDEARSATQKGKFWIDDTGTVIPLLPREHHFDSMARLDKQWYKIFGQGWVRGTIRGHDLSVAFDPWGMNEAVARQLFRLISEHSISSVFYDEMDNAVETGGQEMSTDDFKKYVRSKVS